METDRMVTFTLAGMTFEYDEEKNEKNIRKHGISFKNAARVFFDYDRIEFFDEEHSEKEYVWKRMLKKRILHALYQQEWRQILKVGFIMVNTNSMTREMKEELAFSKEEIEELKKARIMPILFGEDCPETTPERAVKFRRVNPPRQSKSVNRA